MKRQVSRSGRSDVVGLPLCSKAGGKGWRRDVRAFGPTARIAGACICVVLAVVTGACGGKTHDASVMAERAPSPSPGCAGTAAPRSGTLSLRYDGMDRSYDIVIPHTRSDEPMPLVLGYHGYASSPQELAGSWSGSALLDGFVAVFFHGSNLGGSTPPTSTSRPWTSPCSPTCRVHRSAPRSCRG